MIYFARNITFHGASIIRVLWDGRAGPAPIESEERLMEVADEIGEEVQEVSMDELFSISRQRIVG